MLKTWPLTLCPTQIVSIRFHVNLFGEFSTIFADRLTRGNWFLPVIKIPLLKRQSDPIFYVMRDDVPFLRTRIEQ